MKKLSLILFITWTILVVLILSFGVKPYQKIVAYFSSKIYDKENRISDVTLDRYEFSLGKEYYLKYNVSPANYHDMGIQLKSLTPDVFEVIDGKIKCEKNEDSVGKLLITSLVDTKFQKEVELKFKKVYATNFNLSCYNFCYNNKDVYLGVPFLVKYAMSASLEVTEMDDIQIEYDDNYLRLVNQNNETFKFETLDSIHLNDGETIETEIKLKYYGEIVKTLLLRINPVNVANTFAYGIFKTNGEHSKNILKTDLKYYLELFDESDTYIYSTFSFESLNEDIITIDEQNHLVPLKPGNAVIKVNIGTGTKNIDVLVINNIIAPKISFREEYEDGIVKVMDDQVNWFGLQFENEVSYQHFKEVSSNEYLDISYQYNEEELKIMVVLALKKEGKSTLVFKTEDENTSKAISVEIDTIISKVSKESITRRVGKFIGKIAGHASFFVLEAMLAFLFIYYYHFKKKLRFLNVIIYILIGFLLGGLTEFIQLFLPDRNGVWKDVGIDMLGYTFGFIVSSIIYLIIRLIIKIKAKKNKEETNISEENEQKE